MEIRQPGPTQYRKEAGVLVQMNVVLWPYVEHRLGLMAKACVSQ